MERTEIDPKQLPPGRFYGILTAVVVPRPIAWVSTRSADGVDNLAPHSFFTVSSVDPPIVQFTSTGRKDSQRNAEETGEFVVCLTPASLIEQANLTAIDFPAEVDEFDVVGLEREPSLTVAPSRIAASPVALECELERVVSFGASTVVMGRVKHAAIGAHAFSNGRVSTAALEPVGRLGGNDWVHLGRIQTVPRLYYESDWPPEQR
jgi:flavin reductase (DIM6/NTAB) family NADH-FMN oxidoreductase RutF